MRLRGDLVTFLLDPWARMALQLEAVFGVRVMREEFGDLLVRGEGIRLRVPARMVERLAFAAGGPDTVQELIVSGIGVARGRPDLRGPKR
jgi:hypothetical protein